MERGIARRGRLRPRRGSVHCEGAHDGPGRQQVHSDGVLTGPPYSIPTAKPEIAPCTAVLSIGLRRTGVDPRRSTGVWAGERCLRARAAVVIERRRYGLRWKYRIFTPSSQASIRI